MRGPLSSVVLLSLCAATAAADTVTVIARRANVRAEPSAMSALVATLESGARLLVEGRDGDWVKVRLPESVTATTRTGYILSALVRASTDADTPAAVAGAGTPATGSGVAINHEGVGCVVAERFPRFEACFDPADSVSRARFNFRAGDSPHWYFVEMTREGACHAGVIPMPKKTTKKIDYYIEAVDRSFNESRTAEHAPRVVEAAEGCRQKVAGTLSSASVAVGSVSGGAAAVPVGFMPLGVTPLSAAPAAAAAEGSSGASQVAGRTDAATGATQPSSSTTTSDASTAGRSAAAAGGGGIGVGKVLLIGGLLAGGAAAAVVLTRVDPLDVDDDGDGFTENQGDCNDSSPTISPSGGFEFTMDFAYTGTVSCAARNTRQQIYSVRNDNCAALPLQGLQITLIIGGGGCSNTTDVYTHPLEVTQAPPATTTVIRRGVAAGTVAPLCCQAHPCRGGTCTLSFQYTLNTASGSRTIPQTYNVTDNTGRDCPVCGTIGVDETFGFSSAPGVRACPTPVDEP